jgi:hypothetical protein
MSLHDENFSNSSDCLPPLLPEDILTSAADLAKTQARQPEEFLTKYFRKSSGFSSRRRR